MNKIKSQYGFIPIEEFKGKKILITGACGLIGGAIVDLLFEIQSDCSVYVLVRRKSNAEKRFSNYLNNSLFHIIEGDVNKSIDMNVNFHYIINAASNANPNAYVSDPVGTMWTNINGTKNLLEYGKLHGMERFLYVSSGEIYGNGDLEKWKEDDCGHIDCMTMRSCYPTSKRATETLCVAFAHQYGVNVVVARPCHTYGSRFSESDNRAYAQFIRNVKNKENVVLKSRGEQYRSWIYVKDCASAILTILINGENFNAYNIADENSCVTIMDFASTIAELGGVQVVSEMPTDLESKGFTFIKKAIFDTKKIRSLGWYPLYNLYDALNEILNE